MVRLGAAALYNRLPGDIAESVRDLAYRLYHICDRKGWAEDALDYQHAGQLVVGDHAACGE